MYPFVRKYAGLEMGGVGVLEGTPTNFILSTSRRLHLQDVLSSHHTKFVNTGVSQKERDE
jgi:hypothetical protein